MDNKKIIKMTLPRKLNLGCGKQHLEGYWNIDITSDVNPDAVVKPNFTDLPYPDNQFEEVYCSSVLPYIPVKYLEDMLHEACRVCSGVVIIRTTHFQSGQSYEFYMKDTNHAVVQAETIYHLDNEIMDNGGNYWMQHLQKYPDYFKVHSVRIELHANNHGIVRFVERWVNKSFAHQKKYQRLFISRLFPPRCVVARISKRR